MFITLLLQSALDDLKRHLSHNGYPRGIISYHMNDVINKHQNKPKDIITVPEKEIFIVLPYLQSWTKVLGQIYICGAFLHVPNKFIYTCSTPPPPPLLQCWTRVHAISPECQHCIGGWGGGSNAF